MFSMDDSLKFRPSPEAILHDWESIADRRSPIDTTARPMVAPRSILMVAKKLEVTCPSVLS